MTRPRRPTGPRAGAAPAHRPGMEIHHDDLRTRLGEQLHRQLADQGWGYSPRPAANGSYHFLTPDGRTDVWIAAELLEDAHREEELKALILELVISFDLVWPFDQMR